MREPAKTLTPTPLPEGEGRGRGLCQYWRMMRILLRRLAQLAGFCAGLVLLLLVALFIEHQLPVELPKPAGPYLVGRESQVWLREPDALRTTAADRTLLAWIWYPVSPGPSASAPAEYMPAALRSAVDASTWLPLRILFLRDLEKVHVHSLEGTAAPANLPPFPVLVFRPGLSALSLEYSTIAEDLASRGFVVVGIDAPGRSRVVVLPDGSVVRRTDANNPENVAQEEGERIADRLVGLWSDDIAFALERLARMDSDPGSRWRGRFDLSRIGIAGHSLGGATAAYFCGVEPRCRAVVDIDGALRGPVRGAVPSAPLFFLMGDHAGELARDPVARRIQGDIDALYARLPVDTRDYAQIAGANHFQFSDGAVVRSHIAMTLLRGVGVIGLDGRRQLEITTKCVGAFFSLHLQGSAETDACSGQPEVRMRR